MANNQESNIEQTIDKVNKLWPEYFENLNCQKRQEMIALKCSECANQVNVIMNPLCVLTKKMGLSAWMRMKRRIRVHTVCRYIMTLEISRDLKT